MQRRRQKTRGDKQEYFSFKKKEKKKKRTIKVRQREKFQEEATKTLFSKKNAKRKNEKIKICKERKPFSFIKQLNQVEKTEKHFLGEFSKKKKG